jgi:hypothetical protein
MNNIEYVGPNELVFNKDAETGIYSGGFDVNSTMLKGGLSPIITINNSLQEGGSNKVSDLFNNLVIPNWALSYSMSGGKYKDESYDTDSDNDDIDDDLHDKLVGLVREHDSKMNNIKKKKTRKQKIESKKGGTKRRKL